MRHLDDTKQLQIVSTGSVWQVILSGVCVGNFDSPESAAAAVSGPTGFNPHIRKLLLDLKAPADLSSWTGAT